ncbi:MAG: type I restriction-modification enzyme R subunit C-terminal domain-containing protein [Verrucomicrobiota bacterium]
MFAVLNFARRSVIDELREQGIFFEALAEQVGKGYDPFDLVCHVVYDMPPLTRRERAENAQRLIKHLYSEPVISVNATANLLGISNNPARELISALEKTGVLEELTGYKRNRLFIFRRYLAIFADHDI